MARSSVLYQVQLTRYVCTSISSPACNNSRKQQPTPFVPCYASTCICYQFTKRYQGINIYGLRPRATIGCAHVNELIYNLFSRHARVLIMNTYELGMEYQRCSSSNSNVSLLQHLDTSMPNSPDQDERAAEASAAMEADDETPSNAAAQPKGGEDKAAGKLHVLGIGGRRAKRGSGKTSGSKKTPGEIRIQKGETTQHGQPNV